MAGMFEFSATLQGLGEVEAYLTKAQEAVSPPVLTQSLHHGAEIMAQALQANVHVGKADDGAKHPGQLRDSVRATLIGPSTYVVGPDLDHGNVKDYALMEQRGGQIHARNYPVMVFLSAKYGGQVAAVTVTHDRQDYMGKGFHDGAGASAGAIRKAIEESLPKG